MNSYAVARELIDAAHSADPKRLAGRAAELFYADQMEAWVLRLAPKASDLLCLAARCQHLERWSVPRNSYPTGRIGYLAWRKTLYERQAERARQLLVQAGVAPEEVEQVATWVSKAELKTNPNTQLLEDAACLVFLENEISDFASQHSDYPREKFITILGKTWRKMTPAAREAALGLKFPPAVADLLKEAITLSEKRP
ncbi:MAG TPA: DUF4202 domain-containing protein [Terrimicrobiaceae bacterium]